MKRKSTNTTNNACAFRPKIVLNITARQSSPYGTSEIITIISSIILLPQCHTILLCLNRVYSTWHRYPTSTCTWFGKISPYIYLQIFGSNMHACCLCKWRSRNSHRTTFIYVPLNFHMLRRRCTLLACGLTSSHLTSTTKNIASGGGWCFQNFNLYFGYACEQLYGVRVYSNG